MWNVTTLSYIRVPEFAMRLHEHAVWLISTPLGDALRSTDDVEDVDDALVRLKSQEIIPKRNNRKTRFFLIIRLKKFHAILRPNTIKKILGHIIFDKIIYIYILILNI
jgi:hypothetical protein